MIWIIGPALLGIFGWFALRWYGKADPALVKRGLAGFVLLFLGVVMVALVLTGRTSAALPFLFGAFIAYQRLRTGLGLASFLRRLWNASQGRGGSMSESQLRTAYLQMTLDKRSGALSGTFVAGPFEGQALSSLNAAQLIEAYSQLRGIDASSAQLLETYLDRTLGPVWRANYAGGGAGAADHSSAGPMTPARAAEILGVEIDAPEKAITGAHKRLMKIAHPDQGGSDFLAQQINVAKDILLKS